VEKLALVFEINTQRRERKL